MLREYTCIICPNGCDIRAQIEEREDGSRRICSVEGAACPKGRAYVEQELTDPQRNIATSVLVKGGADKSYGIQVAKLAGVPEPVIARAKELVEELASADITAQAKEIAQMSASPQHKAVAKPDEVDLNQMSIFDTVKDDDIIKELGDLELSSMTPIDALNTLYRLQTKLKNRWQ